MNKINVLLENCYGIKSLQSSFDFSQSKTFVIYAPNGVMKTSFAKTFQDISLGNETIDRIFQSRQTIRVVNDDAGKGIEKENIFVIEPYSESYKSDRISTLLVNKTLRDKFEEIHKMIYQRKEILLKEVKISSGIKNEVEKIIAEAITHDPEQFFVALNRIKAEVLANKESQLAEISYQKIFNDKVLKIIQEPSFRNSMVDYIKKYDELLSTSTFFRKGTFNHNNATDIAKNLKDNGFFKADHSVIVTVNGKKIEIKNEKELAEIIQKEKDIILTNPELAKAFDAIDKKLDANKELREFREYIAQNKNIILELDNLGRLKQKLWIAYLAKSREAYQMFMDEYEKSEISIKEITEQAKIEATRWRDVIDIFNDRFFVPFKVSISNQAQVILNNDAPSLVFEFKDNLSGDTVPVGEQQLIRVLSNGERRALYILNIIFEVEARKSSGTNTLFIIDDIADSFDYKNKYAIIEYLSEINETSFFKQIILTHNFDFYRTIASRLDLPRSHHLHTIKSDATIKIVEEHYQQNPFKYWKKNLNTNTYMLIASIPFIRNLAEYCGYKNEYDNLTSLLHIKHNTDIITIQQLEDTLKDVLKDKSALTLPNKNVIVKDLIYTSAEEINIENDENIDLEKKIVLSMAIRLKAEEFMIKKINDITITDIIKTKRNQTIALIKEFSKRFPNEIDATKLLKQVNLMTPENIHLNSFMYEPILDMSNDHLKELYRKICNFLK